MVVASPCYVVPPTTSATTAMSNPNFRYDVAVWKAAP